MGGATFVGRTPGWNVIATGDYNADGIDDVLWQPPSNGLTVISLMSGDAVRVRPSSVCCPDGHSPPQVSSIRMAPGPGMASRLRRFDAVQMSAQDWLVVGTRKTHWQGKPLIAASRPIRRPDDCQPRSCSSSALR